MAPFSNPLWGKSTLLSTVPSNGLSEAYTILKGSSSERPRTVLLFSDGAPTVSGSFDDDYATPAVNIAYKLKQELGATVYSVGLLTADEINASSSKDEGYQIRHFLHFVSSNYPKKYIESTESNPFSKSGDGAEGYTNYCLATSSGSDLSTIFQGIAEVASIGSTKVVLDDATRVEDILTGDFTLATDNTSDIGISVMEVSGYTDDGGYSWAEDTEYPDRGNIVVSFADVTYTDETTGEPVSTKKVVVTGFDFTKKDTYSGSTPIYGNWVGNRSMDDNVNNYHGRKLVITIPIKASDDFAGGYNLPTNRGNSGIVRNDSTYVKFPIPVLDYPSIGIVKKGLAIGESATFKIQRTTAKDDLTPIGDPYTIVLTRTSSITLPYAIIKDLPEGYYTVSESKWSWSYTLSSLLIVTGSGTTEADLTNPVQVAAEVFTKDQTCAWPDPIKERAKCVIFIFENAKKENADKTVKYDTTTYAEAAVKNVFAGGATAKSVSTVHSKE